MIISCDMCVSDILSTQSINILSSKLSPKVADDYKTVPSTSVPRPRYLDGRHFRLVMVFRLLLLAAALAGASAVEDLYVPISDSYVSKGNGGGPYVGDTDYFDTPERVLPPADIGRAEDILPPQVPADGAGFPDLSGDMPMLAAVSIPEVRATISELASQFPDMPELAQLVQAASSPEMTAMREMLPPVEEAAIPAVHFPAGGPVYGKIGVLTYIWKWVWYEVYFMKYAVDYVEAYRDEVVLKTNKLSQRVFAWCRSKQEMFFCGYVMQISRYRLPHLF